jgi:selenocysteine lyase/cysteine desulfurase
MLGRKLIAELINSPSVDDVVLVENASAAVNSILRSAIYKVHS